MPEADRQRWNRRHAEAGPPRFAACYALEQYQHLLPGHGRALDLACGSGGNALALAAHGLSTEAWDIAEVALQQLQEEATRRHLSITTRAMDITPASLAGQRFDVICVAHYLDRELCPALSAALKPGGILIYQTFTREQVSEAGPSNPAYRLGSNELLQLFADLQVLAYREEGTVGDVRQGWRDQALLVAQKV